MSHKPITLPDTDDPYALLDVRPGASPDQIRRAYLRRVKVFKPDRHPAEFRRVREAYDRLREQEAWFDAWRQANEVVRQAQEEVRLREAGEDAEATDPPGTDSARPSHAERATEPTGSPPTAAVIASETIDADPGPDADPELADIEPSDEALRAEALQEAQDDDEPSIEQIVAELETELRLADEAPGPDHHVQADDPAAHKGLSALAQAVHEDLIAERYTAAAGRLLDRETLTLASRPEFSSLLLEACCALVWASPTAFDELVARYGDLIADQDTEFRGGALLHRRTLTEELSAWREAVTDWPQLDRFVMLGSSLRAPAEAELGLHLGHRAASDPTGLLRVLGRAAARAPGIVALYVGMAERWSQRYDRLPQITSRTLPTVEDAAVALAQTTQTHRWVRWEQLRPLLVTTVMGAILIFTTSAVIELAIIGLMLILWAWRAWGGVPEERIYLRVLQPAAASWLWATRGTPNELAVAFAARLPPPGTWGAVLHPGDLSEYPHLLGNDLALLAFGVTAPLIPQLGRSGRGGSS